MRATDYCPECSRPTDELGSRRRDTCPHCGAPLVRDDGARWVNVARVTNLAEAGFLVDELSGEGIEARIYQSEDFNALTDRWLVSYLIQSPPEAAQAAAAQIRQQLMEIESHQQPGAAEHWPEARPPLDPLAWRPIALVVLAGMASFVLGQRLAVERDAKPTRNSLSGAVSAIGRPLVTEPAAGLPRHRLDYHWRDEAWYLDTDADGDGRYETRQRFHASGARW
jgi:hypothetical protein